MKIWNSYGSEHSMDLVLIGKFKHARDAENVKKLVEDITKQAVEDEVYDNSQLAMRNQRFSDAMLKLLSKHNVHSLGSADLEQFIYDAHLELEGDEITVRTEEVEVSAYMKLFIDAGARVEVFSRHDYPEEESQG